MRSILAVPLVQDGATTAVLALVSTGSSRIGLENLPMLELISEQIRLMLDNERLFTAFTEQYLETVKAIARSLDARRPHTEHHHDRVAAVADAVAAELGFSAIERRDLQMAALVHDVGLAGVAGAADAYLADIEHPSVGAGMIEGLPLPSSVIEGVACHHEWFDGWGFPRGLRGAEIPLNGRVLALAEFVIETGGGDSLSEPWSSERLGQEIAGRRGSQFDPEVADAAVLLLERGALRHSRQDMPGSNE
jgi:HD-GYP domain-containing protein (c-di-GMP phosphodiesterase class II)